MCKKGELNMVDSFGVRILLFIAMNPNTVISLLSDEAVTYYEQKFILKKSKTILKNIDFKETFFTILIFLVVPLLLVFL